MKTYVMTTGAIFGLLTAVHLWRLAVEYPHLGTDPFFIVVTLLSAAFCFWAWRLVRRAPAR